MRLAFETIHGIAVPAVSVTRMEEVRRLASGNGGMQEAQLAENAGRNLAVTSMRMLGSHWMESRILVLAGPGVCESSICAARHLANRGASVSLCLASPRKLSASAKRQWNAFQETGANTVVASQLEGDDFDLVIDALGGATESVAPTSAVRDLIQWANDIGAPVLSLDAPCGINATTGGHGGTYIRASQTLTLGLPKTGLLPELTGGLILSDIGIPLGAFAKLGINYTPPFGVDFTVGLRALPTA